MSSTDSPRTTLFERVISAILSVPVRIKIAGIMALPVLILGYTLNYWVRTGLSDWLSYLLTDDRVQVAMMAGSRSVLFITFLAAIASILLSFFLIYILTRPLLQLRQVAQSVARGEFQTRAMVWGKDEIGDVAHSVNTMIDQLVSDREKLKRRNAQLSAINRLAMSASRDLDLTHVLTATLKGTLEVMGLEVGWIYMRDLDDDSIQLACWQGIEPDAPEFQTLIDDDTVCKCQQEITSGKVIEGIARHDCDRFESRLEDSRFPIHLSIPIQARDRTFGVINMACPQETEISHEDFDLLVALGRQVSEIIANAWLHQRLVEKESARQLLLHALVSAQETERTRLARELHDEAGQSLTSLLFRLKALENKAPDGELQGDLGAVSQSVSKAIDQIREISYRFRPPALDEFGIEVALHTLLEEMTRDSSLESHANIDMSGEQLPMELQTSIYRIAQEALTNVLRHARATKVSLNLMREDRALSLCVVDDGIGFDPRQLRNENSTKRLGLLGIQERVEMLGGTCEIRSAPGAGTSLEIQIPAGDAP